MPKYHVTLTYDEPAMVTFEYSAEDDQDAIEILQHNLPPSLKNLTIDGPHLVGVDEQQILKGLN